MLQARLFAYGDAHRYRLGINHSRLPVNQPKGVKTGAQNYGRDGFMRFDANGGRTKNYEPNSFEGPEQTNRELYGGLPVSGLSGHHTQAPREVDDFKQAGDLYRLQPRAAQQRLVDNIAGSLAQVSRDDIIARSIEHFRKADVEFGRRLEEGVAARRAASMALAEPKAPCLGCEATRLVGLRWVRAVRPGAPGTTRRG
jgi:catalase